MPRNRKKSLFKRIFTVITFLAILTITEPVDAQSGDIAPRNFLKADLVVVLKKERRLVLMKGDKV
ncbi:MAG: hypothetical protein VYE62_10635, partial [Pseudomonadota bacterium]|nr:hypothetical protein [Pseudomonadota bacterium]